MDNTVNCYVSLTQGSLLAGEYSCLRVKLLFARQLSFFLVTVYVPCSMTVSVSWMSFWLDHKAVSFGKLFQELCLSLSLLLAAVLSAVVWMRGWW